MMLRLWPLMLPEKMLVDLLPQRMLGLWPLEVLGLDLPVEVPLEVLCLDLPVAKTGSLAAYRMVLLRYRQSQSGTQHNPPHAMAGRWVEPHPLWLPKDT